jgi:hypothetical protein
MFLFEHDLRANAIRVCPEENRFPLFRIMLYPSICVSPQIEIACPEIVRPRGLHMNRI